MTLQQMEYLLTVIEEKKITLAAQKCFISQSAMSQQLKKVEEEVGAILFYRQGGLWLPTEAGEVLLKNFRKILDIYEQSIKKIHQDPNLLAPEISLAMPSSRASFSFAEIYSAFRQKYPSRNLKLIEASFSQIPELIAAGAADMGLFVSPSLIPAEFSKSLQYHPLCPERFVVIALKEQPHARKAAQSHGSLPMKFLNGEKLVMYAKSQFLRQTIDGFFEKYHIHPLESFSFDSTTTCIQFVRNGFGCAIIPEMLSKDSSASDLAIFQLTPPIQWELGILTQKQRSLSLVEQNCILLIRDVISFCSFEQPVEQSNDPAAVFFNT